MSEAKLHALYYDPRVGLLSKTKFVAKVRRLHPEIPRADAAAFADRQALQQQNAPRPFKGFYKIVNLPRHFQVDFFFLKAYARANRGFGTFFIAVDVLSRKMFVYPVKDRTAATMRACIERLERDAGMVEGLTSDDEFEVAGLRAWCEARGILVSTDVAKDDHADVGDKLGIVDAAVRTIRKRIDAYILAHHTTKFVDALPALVESYNATSHGGLRGKAPDDVWDDIDLQYRMFDALTEHNNALRAKVDLRVGDAVRRRVDRGRFDKATARFSEDTYHIVETTGYKYRIADAQGRPHRKRYKYFELSKVRGPAQTKADAPAHPAVTAMRRVAHPAVAAMTARKADATHPAVAAMRPSAARLVEAARGEAKAQGALARAGLGATQVVTSKRTRRAPARLSY